MAKLGCAMLLLAALLAPGNARREGKAPYRRQQVDGKSASLRPRTVFLEAHRGHIEDDAARDAEEVVRAAEQSAEGVAVAPVLSPDASLGDDASAEAEAVVAAAEQATQGSSEALHTSVTPKAVINASLALAHEKPSSAAQRSSRGEDLALAHEKPSSAAQRSSRGEDDNAAVEEVDVDSDDDNENHEDDEPSEDDDDDDDEGVDAKSGHAQSGDRKASRHTEASKAREQDEPTKLRVTRKKLEEVLGRQRALAQKEKDLKDTETFKAAVDRDGRKVSEETGSPALAETIGSMRQEMRQFATPSYLKRITKERAQLERRESQLREEIEAGTDQPSAKDDPEEAEDAKDRSVAPARGPALGVAVAALIAAWRL